MSRPPAPPPDGDGISDPPRTNTLAIVALVVALVFPPAGVVCGHVARRQIAQTGAAGDGLAAAALVVGYLLTGLILVGCCAAMALGRVASCAC